MNKIGEFYVRLKSNLGFGSLWLSIDGGVVLSRWHPAPGYMCVFSISAEELDRAVSVGAIASSIADGMLRNFAARQPKCLMALDKHQP